MISKFQIYVMGLGAFHLQLKSSSHQENIPKKTQDLIKFALKKGINFFLTQQIFMEKELEREF